MAYYKDSFNEEYDYGYDMGYQFGMDDYLAGAPYMAFCESDLSFAEQVGFDDGYEDGYFGNPFWY